MASHASIGRIRKDYLKFHLSETNTKAFVSDKVWEAFRSRVTSQNQDQDLAKEIIAHMRGICRPENITLNEKYQEKENPLDYSDEELIQSTQDLIDRRWADIVFFITEQKEHFNDEQVEMLDLDDFYIHCMGRYDLVEDYDKAMEEFRKQGQ